MSCFWGVFHRSNDFFSIIILYKLDNNCYWYIVFCDAILDDDFGQCFFSLIVGQSFVSARFLVILLVS